MTRKSKQELERELDAVKMSTSDTDERLRQVIPVDLVEEWYTNRDAPIPAYLSKYDPEK